MKPRIFFDYVRARWNYADSTRHFDAKEFRALHNWVRLLEAHGWPKSGFCLNRDIERRIQEHQYDFQVIVDHHTGAGCSCEK